jgi:hypothetical protein
MIIGKEAIFVRVMLQPPCLYENERGGFHFHLDKFQNKIKRSVGKDEK